MPETKTVCIGDLAIIYLAKHPGRYFEYGDLFRQVRLPNGQKLPEGTALQQRVTEKLKQKPYDDLVTKTYTDVRGCIKRVWLHVSAKNAAVILQRHAEKKAKRIRNTP